MPLYYVWDVASNPSYEEMIARLTLCWCSLQPLILQFCIESITSPDGRYVITYVSNEYGSPQSKNPENRIKSHIPYHQKYPVLVPRPVVGLSQLLSSHIWIACYEACECRISRTMISGDWCVPRATLRSRTRPLRSIYISLVRTMAKSLGERDCLNSHQ